MNDFEHERLDVYQVAIQSLQSRPVPFHSTSLRKLANSQVPTGVAMLAAMVVKISGSGSGSGSGSA